VSSPAALSRSISWNFVQAGTSLVVYFLLTPIVVGHLGDVGFGLWVLLNTLLFYLRFLDFGFHNALVKYVAEYSERRDWPTVNGLVGTTTTLLSFAGAAALALSGLIALLIVPTAFHVPAERVAELQLATVLLGVDLLIAFPASVFAAVLEGRQRFDVLSGVSVGTTLMCGVATVGGLQLGYGILALVAIEIARTVFTAIALSVFLRKFSPDIRVSWGRAGGRYFRALRSYSTWTSLNELLAEGGSQVEKLLVPVMLSVSLLTPYSLICTVSAVIFLAIEPITDTFFPLSSAYQAAGDSARLRRLLLRGTKFVVAISLPLAVAVIAYGEEFIRLWIGEEHLSVPAGVAPLVVISFSVTAFIMTGTTILLALAKVRQVFWMGISELVLAVSFVLLAVPRLGLRGLAGSLMLANIVVTFLWIVPYVCRLLSQSIPDFLSQALIRPMTAALPMALIIALLEQSLPSESLWWLSLKMAVASSVYLASLYFLSLTTEEQEICQVGLKSILQREPA
jgi:O-antigen/teichoic acid export membrane protein